MTVPPHHLLGRPTYPDGANQLELARTGMLPNRYLVPGLALPQRMSAGASWLQLPNHGSAQGGTIVNAYGQLQQGGAAPNVGDWVEWDFGALDVREGEGLRVWLIVTVGPNLGAGKFTLDGTDLLTVDTYEAAGYPARVKYAGGLIPGAGGVTADRVRVPRKRTLRMTVAAPNPASTGNFILVHSVCLYSSSF